MMSAKQGKIDSSQPKDGKNDWQIPFWISWSKLIHIVLPEPHLRTRTINKEQKSKN